MTRRDIPLDAREILRVLGKHQVDYVVIGGLAVQAHGHTRTTQDVDLVPEPDPANLERLGSALTELQARPAGAAMATAGQFELLADGVLELDTDSGGVDVHMTPAGAASYADLRSRSLKLDLGDLQILVAGLDDLIAMKRASGRPIDRGDILALTEPD
jgi:Nucleotidyltransferase of unknown function (DUF6036)